MKPLFAAPYERGILFLTRSTLKGRLILNCDRCVMIFIVTKIQKLQKSVFRTVHPELRYSDVISGNLQGRSFFLQLRVSAVNRAGLFSAMFICSLSSSQGRKQMIFQICVCSILGLKDMR